MKALLAIGLAATFLVSLACTFLKPDTYRTEPERHIKRKQDL